jgi:hypothetical protein
VTAGIIVEKTRRCIYAGIWKTIRSGSSRS